MILFETVTGNETQQSGICNFSLFYYQPESRKEVYINKAFAALENQQRLVRRTIRREAAVSGMGVNVGGFWDFATFESAEGCLFKVFARQRRAWNSLIQQACVFIRPREGAAFRKIQIPTLQISGKSRVQHAFVSGRFDLVTMQEAMDIDRVFIQPVFRPMFAEESVNASMTIEVLEREAESKPRIEAVAVQDKTGQTVAHVHVRRRNRRIRLAVDNK